MVDEVASEILILASRVDLSVAGVMLLRLRRDGVAAVNALLGFCLVHLEPGVTWFVLLETFLGVALAATSRDLLLLETGAWRLPLPRLLGA